MSTVLQSVRKGFLVLAIVLCLCGAASANTVVLTPDDDDMVSAIAQYSLGWSFTVVKPIQLAAFGVYGPSGIAEYHDVAIWKSDGTPVVFGGVSPTSCTVLGMFCWGYATPTPLSPGDYVVGAFYTTDADQYYFGTQLSTTISEVAFGQPRYLSGTALAMPTNTYTWTEGYYGANFAIAEVSPRIPEPATFSLIGAAGLILLVSRRSLRTRR